MERSLKRIEINQIICIEKRFPTEGKFLREYNVYSKKLDCTPKLLQAKKSELTLLLECIEGDVLEDVKTPDFSQLAKVIGSLHQSQMESGKVLCQWDTNLRNYLVSSPGGKYYIIDFEHSRMEYAEADITHFLTYWSYLYSSRELRSAVEAFMDGYPLANTLDRDRYRIWLDGCFVEFDRPKWKFGKEELERNHDIPENRRILRNLL